MKAIKRFSFVMALLLCLSFSIAKAANEIPVEQVLHEAAIEMDVCYESLYQDYCVGRVEIEEVGEQQFSVSTDGGGPVIILIRDDL